MVGAQRRSGGLQTGAEERGSGGEVEAVRDAEDEGLVHHDLQGGR